MIFTLFLLTSCGGNSLIESTKVPAPGRGAQQNRTPSGTFSARVKGSKPEERAPEKQTPQTFQGRMADFFSRIVDKKVEQFADAASQKAAATISEYVDKLTPENAAEFAKWSYAWFQEKSGAGTKVKPREEVQAEAVIEAAKRYEEWRKIVASNGGFRLVLGEPSIADWQVYENWKAQSNLNYLSESSYIREYIRQIEEADKEEELEIDAFYPGYDGNDYY